MSVKVAERRFDNFQLQILALDDIQKVEGLTQLDKSQDSTTLVLRWSLLTVRSLHDV